MEMEPVDTDRCQPLETGEIPCTNCGIIMVLDTMKVSDQSNQTQPFTSEISKLTCTIDLSGKERIHEDVRGLSLS
jgi:hypothetical protein